MDQKKSITFLESMSGPLDYPLTNDYMFRALMQSSNNTLRHLLAALLDVPYEEIYSCEILNPIILGEAIDQKTCVMDVRVCMNNDRLINLEMQMYPYAAWPDRALFYLCRLYCSIKRGQDYSDALPSVHIGILNKSPFPEVDKFYSKYELADIEDPEKIHVFTGNFSLRVLNLSQLDNVSGEGRSSEIYTWAQLFRATTWEEVKMLAEKNNFIQEASEHLHILTEDEKIRLQCEGREMYERDMASARGDGRRAGREEGRQEGRQEGKELVNRLNELLLNDGRLDDLRRAVKDPEYQEQLMKEYGIQWESTGYRSRNAATV